MHVSPRYPMNDCMSRPPLADLKMSRVVRGKVTGLQEAGIVEFKVDETPGDKRIPE